MLRTHFTAEVAVLPSNIPENAGAALMKGAAIVKMANTTAVKAASPLCAFLGKKRSYRKTKRNTRSNPSSCGIFKN